LIRSVFLSTQFFTEEKTLNPNTDPVTRLTLRGKPGQQFVIEGPAVLHVCERNKFIFIAKKSTRILRMEVYERLQNDRPAA
jgi:hypothetical protein